MKVSTITLTGADDSIAVKNLLPLAWDAPRVEFGILFSKDRQGKEPRYPSESWIVDCARELRPLRLSAHLCGQLARDAFAGAQTWFATWGQLFHRVQLNGFPAYAAANRTNRKRWYGLKAIVKRNLSIDFILQVNDRESLSDAQDFAAEVGNNISVLYDVSGGKGISPTELLVPAPGLRIGYAGGINVDNVQDMLAKIALLDPQGAFSWIDMESSLREVVAPTQMSDQGTDVFSMSAATAVLKKCLEVYSGSKKLDLANTLAVPHERSEVVNDAHVRISQRSHPTKATIIALLASSVGATELVSGTNRGFPRVQKQPTRRGGPRSSGR